MKDFDLVIDVGNTRTKVGWFEDGRCKRTAMVEGSGTEALMHLVTGPRPRSMAIASVGPADEALLADLTGVAPVIEITGATPLPIHNGYSTPMTLGADRIANVVGAFKLFPKKNVLVIDAGTCITYDLIDAEGTYLGGAISPGLAMRSQAMHEHSARLPLVKIDGPPPGIGRSTTESLAAGVYYGTVAELRGMIAMYGHQRPDMAVILTGGDALTAARALKSGIFAHPILTLEGLHAILVHNRDAHGIIGYSTPERGESSSPSR